MNKGSEDVMTQPPRDKGEPIVGSKQWVSIIVYAICISLSVLGLMFYAISLGIDIQTVNNLTFYTLVLTQLVHVFNLPQRNQSFFVNQVTSNKYIWFAIVLCVVITFFAYYQPTVQQVLSLKEIKMKELLLIIPFGLAPVLIIQILKRLGIVE